LERLQDNHLGLLEMVLEWFLSRDGELGKLKEKRAIANWTITIRVFIRNQVLRNLTLSGP